MVCCMLGQIRLSQLCCEYLKLSIERGQSQTPKSIQVSCLLCCVERILCCSCVRSYPLERESEEIETRSNFNTYVLVLVFNVMSQDQLREYSVGSQLRGYSVVQVCQKLPVHLEKRSNLNTKALFMCSILLSVFTSQLRGYSVVPVLGVRVGGARRSEKENILEKGSDLIA